MLGNIVDLPIEDELKNAYLTYAMSVIISRALPDVRDGLKPSQRRILVAMHDLNLGPASKHIKSAKICGDTSGNYHPHGESVIYPTLVRMAQDWNLREVLVDKQGNWGSIAGLPAAAMRYTEARLSYAAAMMLEDIDQDTVDFVPTYDDRLDEPVVLPSKFPNLLINGSSGIAVGMSTSIPPHNLTEVCRALIALIDDPEIPIDGLMEHIVAPDFPTGGVICGKANIRRAYYTGRANIIVRAKARIEEVKNRSKIYITEIPYQQTRDRIIEKIAELVREDRIKGISELRDESSLEEPVSLVIEVKRDADPEVVLAQLFQFSPLQETFSITMLALVDGKPRTLNLKEMLQEYIRHRLVVIRRRTQFQLNKAKTRKHTVEGLLLAFANIDEIIRIIRTSTSQPEARQRLMGVPAPAAMMERALGAGFAAFQQDRGVASEYFLTAVQSDAILAMRLGQLVNLEQDKLAKEFGELLAQIQEALRILADEALILAMIREDLVELERRRGNPRRTIVDAEELGQVDLADLIAVESMAVTISHKGYIKRTPSKIYRSQRRGGKGLKGAKADDEDPIEHLFVASSHDYLLFFTNLGRVYWQKVYDLPELGRESRGRAIVNLLNLGEGERIAQCMAVRDFSEPGRCLMMATRRGVVKKTPLEAYSRPLKGGIIAIKLRPEDELVDVAVTKPQDEVVLTTADGMAIRFSERDARPMGRNTSGVKGITLKKDDYLVSMAVAQPEATLFTLCENGYGKRTPFGPSTLEGPLDDLGDDAVIDGESVPEGEGSAETEAAPAWVEEDAAEGEDEGAEGAEGESSGQRRYRTQRRGGKGLRDIKTTARNGKVVCGIAVRDDLEVLMITKQGKMQRVKVDEIRTLGRNTQGVRIMNVDSGDLVVAVVSAPSEEAPLEDVVEPAPLALAGPRLEPSADTFGETEDPVEDEPGESDDDE